MLQLLCKWLFISLSIWKNSSIRNIAIKEDAKVGEIVSVFPLTYKNITTSPGSNLQKYFEFFKFDLNGNEITGLRLKVPAKVLSLNKICPILLFTNATDGTSGSVLLSIKISRKNHLDKLNSGIGNNLIFHKEKTESATELDAVPMSRYVSKTNRRVKREWDWREFDVMEEMDPPVQVSRLKSSFDNRTGTVLYFMEGEGVDTAFKIGQTDGKIETLTKLNRESKSSYALKVYATDLNHKIIEGPSSVIVTVLDINDQKPVFEKRQYFAFVEERCYTGTEVTTVQATDGDDSKRAYGQIRYSIVGGSSEFSIHPTTGVIRTTVNNLDREMRDEYKLVIKARDAPDQPLGFSTTTNVTIMVTDVNDNPPKFVQEIYQLHVLEDAEIGSEVTRIKSTDLDESANKISQYFISGENSDLFSVSTEDNIAVIRVAEPIDYETSPNHKYKLTLTAKNVAIDERFDYIKTEGSTAVIVNVVDVDEQPEFLSKDFKFHVKEDVKPGHNIGIAQAKDPEDDIFGYKLLSNTERFSINPVSGMISLKTKLDREIQSSHKVTVQAGYLTKAIFTIYVDDVNDNPPELKNKDLEVILCIGNNEERQILYPPIEMVDKDDDKTGGKPFHFYPTKSTFQSKNFEIIDNGDSTASLRTRHTKFRRSPDTSYQVPILVSDSGNPKQNATYIIIVKTCYCSEDSRDICGAAPIAAALRIEVLIAILTTVLFLLFLIITVLFVKRLRKRELEGSNQKLSIYDEEDDVRENVFKYAEEGGGEEDTAAYDITALSMCGTPRSSITPLKMKLPVKLHRPESCDMHAFIESYKGREDEDGHKLPFDSLQIYAYEGEGSLAGSLSSIASCDTDDDDQVYDHMKQWGPRFSRLADIYNRDFDHSESEDEQRASPAFNYTFASQGSGSVRKQTGRQKQRLVRTATPL